MNDEELNDKYVIRITTPKIIRQEGTTTFDYDESHLIYNGQDLGNFVELSEMKSEKEQLIAYLEEKIKQCNKLLNKGNPKPYGEERNLYENSLLRYTEILNILKGGEINE